MSSVAIVDVSKICRVCLGCEREMKFLFEPQQSPTIAEMLSELTIYKIQNVTELPHLICSQCSDLVITAYELKEKCEKSHRTLIALLDKPTNDLNFNKNSREKSTQTQAAVKFTYPCQYCDEKFLTLEELELHIDKKHFNSSKSCRFCSRSFKCIEDLNTHLSVFHPDSNNKFYNECHICKHKFTKGAHLIRHIQTRHKFFKLEIQAFNEPEFSAGSLEEEANNTGKYSKENAEILNLVEVEDVGHLTDEENEISLKLLLESSNTAEVLEDVAKKTSDEDADISLESQNCNEMEENNSLEDNLAPAKHSRGRCTKNAKTKANSEKNLNEQALLQVCNVPSTESLPPNKRGRGRPSLKPYNCKYCSIYCENDTKLQQHILEHHNTQTHKFSCKLCNDIFTAKKDLAYHLTNYHKKTRRLTSFMRSKTKNSQNLFYCSKCDKNFSTKNSLQRHQENHDKKRYVCKECLQDFANKEELNVHTKTEGHDKPLLCPECGLRCKSSNILTVHLRRHNGEKPFKCKFCTKGFPRIDDLKIHEKYHTGEKSHFCETCGKGFFRKYNLRIHLRVHTGEKPHKCPHCPQAFAQSNDLKAHIRRHTGERFRCEICNAGFLQGYQIRQHKLQEHGIREIPPTQRLQKFTSPEEQEEQIKQNLQVELE